MSNMWDDANPAKHQRWYASHVEGTVICPFCECDFLPGEKRPLVECSVCKGTYDLAKEADAFVQEQLPRLSVDELRDRIRWLGDGYWRAEYRNRLRELER